MAMLVAVASRKPRTRVDLGREDSGPVVKELARVIETAENPLPAGGGFSRTHTARRPFRAGDHIDERVCQFLYWTGRADGTRKLELLSMV